MTVVTRKSGRFGFGSLASLFASPSGKGKIAYGAGRFQDAARHWRRAAGRGDPEAAFRVGELYERGEGVRRSVGDAAHWYRKAAERGHVTAQGRLGRMLLSGDSHHAEGRWAWFAEQRAADSARSVSEALFPQGRTLAADPQEALHWLTSAADGGDEEAAVRLGAVHYTGVGGVRDFEAARKRFLQGAVAGLPGGQFGLGDL